MIIPIARAVWASPVGRKVTAMAASAVISKVTRLDHGVGGHGPGATDNVGNIVRP